MIRPNTKKAEEEEEERRKEGTRKHQRTKKDKLQPVVFTSKIDLFFTGMFLPNRQKNLITTFFSITAQHRLL